VLSGRLERLGAATGFSLTSDRVTLRLSTLTENLEPALELFRAALLEPNFAADEFAQLQAELASGWISDREESKQLRAQEVYQQRIYRGGPQSYRADGLLSGIRAAALADVRAQYARLLAGREAICAVLSNLSRAEVEARILARLALPPAPAGAPGASAAAHPWADFTPPPRPAGHRVSIVVDEQANTDEVLLGGFSVAQTVPDWHLHQLISYTFGGDMNSRLFRTVRGERGLSYGASCWYEASGGRVPRNRPAPFTLYTFPSTEHTVEAVPLVLELYRALIDGGLTTEELALARLALVNSYPFRRDTPQKLLMLEIDEALYGVHVDDDATYRAKLEGTTPAALAQALRDTHRADGLEIVLLGDPARLEPIAAALPGVDKVERVRYPEA
jgi:zinc protease